MEEACIFCQIVKGEKPAEFLYRGANVVAFKDIRPHAPVHVLLAPTRHIRSINDLADDDRGTVAEMIWRAREVAGEMGISRFGVQVGVQRGKRRRAVRFSPPPAPLGRLGAGSEGVEETVAGQLEQRRSGGLPVVKNHASGAGKTAI